MTNPKTYRVGSSAGRSGYASTLAEAKVLGAKIAKQEAWRGKWNVLFITISISKQDGIGYYKATGWQMYVPVRGSGASADRILSEMKMRTGVAPFKWVKK